MDRNLEGRVALVTGASSGIGASVVRRLLAAGARVHGVARRQQALDAVSPSTLAAANSCPMPWTFRIPSVPAHLRRTLRRQTPLTSWFARPEPTFHAAGWPSLTMKASTAS